MDNHSPLSSLPQSAINQKTLGVAKRVMESPFATPAKAYNDSDALFNGPPSSPFDADLDQENAPLSIQKTQPKSDLKNDSSPQKSEGATQELNLDLLMDESIIEPVPRPQKQLSPLKSSRLKFSPTKQAPSRFESSPLRDNEGLTVAVETMQKEKTSTWADSAIKTHEEEHFNGVEHFDEQTNIDDTCFSTFSEVPDMTQFSKLGQRSPTRTPKPVGLFTPRTARSVRQQRERSASPTPRRSRPDNDTTNLLLDFTQQMESYSGKGSRTSPSRLRHSPSKSATTPNLLSFINNQRSPVKGNVPSTPSEKRNILNLLDFELPPAPTPRSVPTITIRELESMKSSYQSQISSLNATISGREAEVESLKKAVADAERRAGDAQEQARMERSSREDAEKEKADWVKRGNELEEVLGSIKGEIIASEKEREDMLRRLEESENKTQDAELRAAEADQRAVEAESKLLDQTQAIIDDPATDGSPRFTAEQVQKQIDEKVATLCKELHVVYKKKHETKVAALKKSYEAKAEKRSIELQKKVEEMDRQLEEALIGHNATLSTGLPVDINASSRAEDSERLEQQQSRLEEQQTELEEQRAKLAGLEQEVRAARNDYSSVLGELEQERIEKGELVAAVDEMLALQSDANSAPVVEDFRRSMTRPTGLKGPGFSGIKPPSLSRSASSKSRLMGNIERMGALGRTAE